jgi:lysozyme family protein
VEIFDKVYEVLQKKNAGRIGKDHCLVLWNSIHGNQLSYPLGVLMLDCALKHDADVAKKLLQKTVGVAQNGIMDKHTMHAVLLMNTSDLYRFTALRALRYTGTRNFDTDGILWLTDLFELVAEVSNGHYLPT